MTLIFRGRTSRARARKPAETPAFAAEYATIPAVGISATIPLALATNPPGSSTGIAACASRSGSIRSRATISSTTARGVSASGPNATAPARQITPSSPPSRSRCCAHDRCGRIGHQEVELQLHNVQDALLCEPFARSCREREYGATGHQLERYRPAETTRGADDEDAGAFQLTTHTRKDTWT